MGHREQPAEPGEVGAASVAAVSPPTALSWAWAIDDFVELLAAAAANAT